MDMTKARTAFIVTLGLATAAVVNYGIIHHWTTPATFPNVAPRASAAERPILYYRDPSGAPAWSATPKADAQGRAYIPVYDDAEPNFEPTKPALGPLTLLKGGPSTPRKILYYRNPMGLPDTSPTPKKDSMGMDYIAVYEAEEPREGKSIKVSLDRVQRTGVRTEPAQARIIVRPLSAVGAVAIDERRATIVTMRSDGYVEDLFVNTTGQHVHAGQPLFRVYSPDIQQALSDMLVTRDWVQRGSAESVSGKSLDGAMQRLRNLGLSEARIREIRDSGTNPRTIDWLAPASGTVMSKQIINGQKIVAGNELYRIVDLTNLWVIADVAEGDLAEIKPGMRATVTFRAYRGHPAEGVVTFIYPEIRTETRTGRVRIEIPNPDELLKPDMYTDVVFQIDAEREPVTSVPASAIIDNGTKRIVLVAKGDGRFEPRSVKIGRRGDGYVEITEGLRLGEDIVTTATFLIDAESNLQTALKTFTEQEQAK